MRYSIEDILKVRDQTVSWLKKNSVLDVWKRKSKRKLFYSVFEITAANQDDFSWICPKKIVEVSLRKYKKVYI
jgi:hypothetical protein